MEIVKIKGTVRGSEVAKDLRKAGNVLCNIYGGGENMTFYAHAKAFKSIVYTPDFKIAEIEVGGTTHKCILKELQFHPVTEAIEHLDFLRLIDGQPLKVDVPVRFRGTSPGVKLGGKLQTNLRRVKIKTTPEFLVDKLVFDISGLKLGDAVRVREADMPEGIEILSAGPTPVASVEIPRALRSASANKEGETEKA